MHIPRDLHSTLSKEALLMFARFDRYHTVEVSLARALEASLLVDPEMAASLDRLRQEVQAKSDTLVDEMAKIVPSLSKAIVRDLEHEASDSYPRATAAMVVARVTARHNLTNSFG